LKQTRLAIRHTFANAVIAGLVITVGWSAIWTPNVGGRDDWFESRVAARQDDGRDADQNLRRPPGTIVGRATVIDADTIKIRGRSIRLFGIDALEDGQKCLIADKRQRCAQRAALALADKIGDRNVVCDKRARDRYGRIVGVCRVRNVNLNAWLVAKGWALAYRRYSRLYVEHERAAQQAKRGIWQTRFVKPWQARRGKRLGQRMVQRRCAIKGNIGGDGERIYHVPGGYYYARTRIDEADGERWFCSEAEARGAGWRRAFR